MTNILNLTADKILGIDLTNPEKLFSFYDHVNQYRLLAKKWHPDRNTDVLATKVFSHISLLHVEAEKHIAENMWNGPSVVSFESSVGKKFQFKYRLFHNIQIGKMYIGYKHLLYVIEPGFKDLYENALEMIASVKYPKPKFEEQFKRQIPNVIESFESNIGFIVLMEKTDDLILLKDLLNHIEHNKLPAVHVAWIISTLSNLACFLEMNNIAHGAILSDTYWVTPKYHSGVLLGGWWYARPNDSKLLALPQESLSVLSSKIHTDKKAKTTYDRTLIKCIGIEALGDSTKTGTMLLTDKSVPAPVLSWLRGPNASDAIKEYKMWGEARDKGFGLRKFHELKIDPKNIY